ncbi:ectoine hydroxylase-related dioxygenase (phytanoyl-CoA dioxygenase family) [Rhodoligotrophos appendicifer]|uniref:phytanoyl-CoA dioxygenase family protein n=1 Tax=Rhodoligotrophos appendicifer TaxID=987056 RepID=UPI0014795942|nr:phytanoyl-CoA dioxygenase family protein [Rhodoligotrophos appendicifer]
MKSLPWDPDALPKATQDQSVLEGDLRRWGYCIIDRAIVDQALETLQRRLADQAAAERTLHNMKNPANTDPVNQWVGMLLNKGEIFFQLIEHELAMSMIELMIGSDYLISCVDAQIQHPGAGTMPLHTDQWWMPQPQRPGSTPPRPADARRNRGQSLDFSPASEPIAPIAAVNVMWMVTDFTEAGGATRLVPGSHLSGSAPDASVPHKVASVPAVGPAGTAFAFDARLWHGAAPNRTQNSRFGLTVVGCGPQFRPLENYSRGLRPEVVARCSPEILKRLGFSAWSSYGHTGDPEAVITACAAETIGELQPH